MSKNKDSALCFPDKLRSLPSFILVSMVLSVFIIHNTLSWCLDEQLWIPYSSSAEVGRYLLGSRN